MEEIFNSNTGVKEIVVQLLADNIKLQAELQFLQSLFDEWILQTRPDFDRKMLQDMRANRIESIAMSIVAEHPLYSEVWKKNLKGLEGLGVSF